MSNKAELEKKCIDTIRFLAADAIEKAKSGHPGMTQSQKSSMAGSRSICSFRRSCVNAFIRPFASHRLRSYS